MKKYLAIVVLLSSLITFSQTKDKEINNLFDSIKAVDPYRELYSQIDRLEAEKKNIYQKELDSNQNYEELEEFYIRQDLYKRIFDKLELGIAPDQSELTFKPYNYTRIQENWLFEFPKSGDNSKIIVYYQLATDHSLNGSLSSGGYPFKDFGLAFFEGDTILKKRYPHIYSMIKEGKIVFESRDFTPLSIAMGQAPKLEFPNYLFTQTDESADSKKELAKNLLSWISEKAGPAYNKSYKNKRDIIADYLEFENEKITKNSVDEKILMRLKFIEYLKKNYQMLWK